jgi:invasion protein IalB
MTIYQMRRLVAARCLLPALLLLCPVLAGAESAAAQEVRSSHGDWQIRCDSPPGALAEQCALMQSVTAEDRQNVGLTVIILETADGQDRILRVLAPLGVLLPSGLGLRIDDEDVGRASFIRCLPNGCIAEVIIDDELVGQLSEGEMATFIIFQTPEEGIGIPLSLAGFDEGYAALP